MIALTNRSIRVQKLTIFLAFLLTPIIQVDAQEYFRTEKLKLALTVGNQVVMAFDEAKGLTSNTFNSLSKYEKVEKKLNDGDYFFYSGENNKAIKNYYAALDGMLPEDIDRGEPIFSVYKRSERKDIRFTYAEKLLKRAKDINLDTDGMLLMASAFNTIGIYYHHLGNIKVAEKLYLKALEVRGKYAGKTSEYYVASLHNLSVVRISQGRYDAAEDMLKYVLRYYKSKMSATSYQYAIASTNQAMLNANLGRTEDAILVMKDLVESSPPVSFPTGSLDRARILVNMGLVEIERENYQLALEKFLSAQSMYKNLGVEKHPDYSKIKIYIAQVQLALGNLAQLGEFIDDALNEAQSEFDDGTLAYSYLLETKAQFLFEKGDYSGAKDLYQKISSIRLAQLGVLHIDYLSSVNYVATCHWKLNNIDLAYQNYEQVVTSYLDVVEKYFYNMSEREKTQFWANLKMQLNVFYSFAFHVHTELPKVLPLAYDTHLKTKGLLMNNSNMVRESIYASTDQSLIELYNEWVLIKEDLSFYYTMSKESIEELEIDIPLLEVEANEIEKEINLNLFESNFGTEFNETNHTEIAEALSEDEIAIEVLRIDNRYGTTSTSDTYAALTLSATNDIALIKLTDADDLETRYIKYYRNAIKNQIQDEFTYDIFWTPLELHLGGKTRLFISLDGVYNLISLNSLKNKDDQYLLDTHEIYIVPNTSVITKKRKPNENQEAVFIGNPTFNNKKLSPLPGTEVEVESISRLVGQNTLLLTKNNATETAIRNVKNPRILHIATHGFFLEDAPRESSFIESVNYSNPLLRSGLYLADVENEERNSDGILTAFEALDLNLRGTELVVLSACETGTGEVINGEGVYGLTRSMNIAGAKNLLISLWKVDDKATQQLMTLFYREWIQSDNLNQSFNRAQKQLRDEYPEPYYWAAFVMIRSQ